MFLRIIPKRISFDHPGAADLLLFFLDTITYIKFVCVFFRKVLYLVNEKTFLKKPSVIFRLSTSLLLTNFNKKSVKAYM